MGQRPSVGVQVEAFIEGHRSCMEPPGVCSVLKQVDLYVARAGGCRQFVVGEIAVDGRALVANGNTGNGAAAAKRVEDDVARTAACQDAGLDEGLWKNCEVAA